MLTGLYQLNQLEAQAFEDEVYRRISVVSNFGEATQIYINQQSQPAIEAKTDALILEGMSSFYAVRSLFEIFNETMPEYMYRQPSLNPLNPSDQADDFEAGIIRQFQNDHTLQELTGYRQQNGAEKFYVAHPITVEASCLKCHGNPDNAPSAITDLYGKQRGYNWNVDEIISALMIYVPTTDLRFNQAGLQRASIFTFLILISGLAITIFLLFEKLINQRISILGRAITQQAITPDSLIHLNDTSQDELGQLSRRFNDMANALSKAYQNLENKVAERTRELTQALQVLKNTQAQLVHTEKMSSLGRMVGGIAHEINNPASFIHGNLRYTKEYTQTLIDLIKQIFEQVSPEQLSKELQKEIEEADLSFLETDFQKLIVSMQTGTERIRNIVLSLRNFARLDESDYKVVDIHEGIESTLLILQGRLKETPQRKEIIIHKDYTNIPSVKCYPSQLNQAIFHLLNNAIDAVENLGNRQPEIKIKTDQVKTDVRICISDNGVGISDDIYNSIFDPFFTTKPVGQGTGLGLSISHQIVVETHGGELLCESISGQGTSMIIFIPNNAIIN